MPYFDLKVIVREVRTYKVDAQDQQEAEDAILDVIHARDTKGQNVAPALLPVVSQSISVDDVRINDVQEVSN